MQRADCNFTMYALLDFSTFLIAIVIAFLPATGYPDLEGESLFTPDSGSLEPLLDDNIAAADAFYTDQGYMTDVLGSEPLFTENPDVFYDAPTDIIDTDNLNPDLLGGLDSPVLLAADYDWDWDCPDGKQSFCCSERGVTILIPTDFGGCRNRASFTCLFSNFLTPSDSYPMTGFLGFYRA